MTATLSSMEPGAYCRVSRILVPIILLSASSAALSYSGSISLSIGSHPILRNEILTFIESVRIYCLCFVVSYFTRGLFWESTGTSIAPFFRHMMSTLALSGPISVA